MAIPATDAGMALLFLRHLFKSYTDGFIEIRPLSKHRPHANRTTYRLPHCLLGNEGRAMAEHIVSLSIRGYDVYCGVCPRSAPEGPGRKLGREAINQIGAVWIDLDAKIPGSSKEILDDCDIIVSTGNGWHGYIMAKSIINVGAPKDRTAAETKIRSWANSVLPGTDNVSNIDRILRVPGTLNWKNVDEPKAVTLIKGGGLRPTYRESLCVQTFGDVRLDALLASARAGELGHANPPIRHESGRITGCLDTFFLEMDQACKLTQSNANWQYLINIVQADLPEIMRYYFGR